MSHVNLLFTVIDLMPSMCRFVTRWNVPVASAGAACRACFTSLCVAEGLKGVPHFALRLVWSWSLTLTLVPVLVLALTRSSMADQADVS